MKDPSLPRELGAYSKLSLASSGSSIGGEQIRRVAARRARQRQQRRSVLSGLASVLLLLLVLSGPQMLPMLLPLSSPVTLSYDEGSLLRELDVEMLAGQELSTSEELARALFETGLPADPVEQLADYNDTELERVFTRMASFDPFASVEQDEVTILEGT